METQLRKTFAYLNKFFMVPLFRLGFGRWIGTPFGGYIMVLQVRGRKTGKTRFAPVNYAIENGAVYCLSGFGVTADWYRNLRANPHVTAMLPSGALAGVAEPVDESAERLRVLRRVLINAGFAGFFYGYDPRHVSDERLEATTREVVAIRIRPTGIGAGAHDPGGWAWVFTLALNLALFVWLGCKLKPRGK